jgi:hypothetical protein
MPLHRAQHVPDPIRRTLASAQGVLGPLFPLIVELPRLADSIARGGMVSGAPRGNGLGPHCRANAEARQRSSRSSVHAGTVWTFGNVQNRGMSALSNALGCSIGHALSKLMHRLQHLKTRERRLSEASALKRVHAFIARAPAARLGPPLGDSRTITRRELRSEHRLRQAQYVPLMCRDIGVPGGIEREQAVLQRPRARVSRDLIARAAQRRSKD